MRFYWGRAVTNNGDICDCEPTSVLVSCTRKTDIVFFVYLSNSLLKHV